MNDLKQIQDFFSKPLKEENQPQFKKGDKVTYLGHPAVVTATKEYNGKNFVSVSYDKGTGKTKASDILATSGAVKPLKENVDKKYNDFLITLRDSGVTNMYGAVPYLQKAFGLNRKEATEILVNWMRSFSKPLKEDKKLIYNDFVRMVRDDMMAGSSPDEKPSDEQVKKKAKAYYNNYLQGASVDDLFEVESKDPIDTITMDVPLFIRILEYSREDAQTDMDLHDLAEKAIAGTKQQGILSMDDYNMLIGDSESLNEQSLDDQAKAYFLAKVKRGEIDTLPKDPKAEFLAQMMKDQIDHDKETLRRERSLEERISKALNELNEELCAKGKRYIKARKRAGEKSSAYLSGRAVKVCKGSIKWPKKGRKKVNEIEDNGDEEKAFDAELMATANGIASTLGKELKAKQGDKEKLDEGAGITIIASVLTANALVSFISKMAAKLFKKLNFKKGEDIAEKIHKWAHDNETAFQAPIKRVLKFFIKDEQKLDTITKAVYAIVVASMAAGYGVEAVSGLAKADWFKGALSSLKALAKSDEAIVNAYPAIKSLVA